MGPNGILGTSMQGGYLQPIPPDADSQRQISTLNDIINRLNTMLKSQVFSDGTNKRMIIGYQKDGWGVGKDFGMKVSIPGVDVTAASDSQLLFKMDMETWFFYDADTHKNYMQMGTLPDGTGGFVIADDGYSVDEVYS